jgi:uncharacterized SAM-binding protein YcdF (DUF218 family)
MDLFLIKKTLTSVILPPNGPLLLVLLGLLILKRRPKFGRSLVWMGFLTLVALSTQVVAFTLERMVNDGAPLNLYRASDAKAIVILGGGLRRRALEYGGDTLNGGTLERVRYGALIARRTGLPVLVSGGVAFAGTSEAKLMKQTLEIEFGVKVRWTEIKSRNTHENAIFTAMTLREVGIHKVILVTHAIHMPRAEAEFAAAGMQVIPAATAFPGYTSDSFLDFVPGISWLNRSHSALYELTGKIAYLARK